ncbi:alpha/beta fold hydrolase [Streptomyces sp. NPDC088762]|uniref:alpha/beta fold hydrolase n=1 Tax=Streptomyces sp. NPDC088762 TaxID=3365891 RepID=UPI0038112BD6
MMITYEEAGSGPAVVLLHSSVCDRRMWDGQWKALQESGYRVVRCDFRGFGQTAAPDGPYSPWADVQELLDALGIERAALVGSSFGGRVALQLAALRPDRVGAMVLLCPARPGHEPSAELEALDEQEIGLIESGDLDGAVELNVRTWLGPEADAQARAKVRQMQRHAFDVQLAAEEEFGSIPVEVDLRDAVAPTLVFSGGHDLQDFRHIAAGLPEVLPNAEHREVPWAGHLPSVERPEETAELLVAALNEVWKP